MFYPSTQPESQFRQLPKDVLCYQFLPFVNNKSAVKLAQASRELLQALRHKIRKTQVVNFRPFIRQSYKPATSIGAYCDVIVTSKDELNKLLQHIANEIVIKFHPLIKLTIWLNTPLGHVILPVSLHTLSFGHQFNQPITNLILPSTLHTLRFSINFNQPLNNITLPANLHTLEFGYGFNQPITDLILPERLHTLKFGTCFNQPLNNITLPANLHVLSLGFNFNQSLSAMCLPENLVIDRKVCQKEISKAYW